MTTLTPKQNVEKLLTISDSEISSSHISTQLFSDDETFDDSVDDSYNAIMDFLAKSEMRKVDSTLLVEEGIDNLLEKIEKLKPYVNNVDIENNSNNKVEINKIKNESSPLVKFIYVLSVAFTLFFILYRIMKVFSSDKITPHT
eukprot:TRINITY_DN13714_c0_g1_i1.p1 TRINITY_DN13714_c0_g1~~TRINITY_DN13714_c0_g1_i1.p1  ORF type:complete len:152 (+),score=40.93 TRINITY_DN13714_c0_g1_i1:28-456(+)